MFGGIPWQVYFQRALACKTPRKAQIVSFVASLCCLLMPIPAVLIGAVGVKTGKVRTFRMQSSTDPHLTGAAFNLRGHPVFWALVSPAEKNQGERSDDRKYVCGFQARRHSPRRSQNAGRYKLIFLNFLSGHHRRQARMVEG